MRRCHCCESEYLGQIDARLQAGESKSQIARDYGLSPDSVERHSKHADKSAGTDAGDLREHWDRAYKAALALHRSCITKGDDRGGISALARSVEILEKRSRLVSLDENSFESQSVDEQACRVVADKTLLIHVLDRMIFEATAGQETSAAGYVDKCKSQIAPMIHGQQTDNP